MVSKKIIWEAYEHNHKDKSNDWFWAVGIIAIAGAVLAIYFNNLLFALLILIAAFAAFLQAHTKPRLMRFEIGRKGVRAGQDLFPYSTLESFWVIDEEVDDKIILKSKKLLMPYIVLPYDSEEIGADEFRDYLLEYIDEEEIIEPLHQKIMEALGF